MHIEKTYQLPHPVDVIYEAWVSSKTVIPPATSMDINPVVGGHYRLLMETPEFNTGNSGVFHRVEPNEQVTYTWQWQDSDEVTVIDARFQTIEKGTELTLRHSGFLTEESRQNHDTGWDSYIEGLLSFLSD